MVANIQPSALLVPSSDVLHREVLAFDGVATMNYYLVDFSHLAVL